MKKLNRAETYVNYFKMFYDTADPRCRDYWGTSKPNGQAAGLESLCAFAGMVLTRDREREKRPRPSSTDGDNLVVVDAGAGASSAILRTYFKNVISCDPDPEYIKQVRYACELMGLGHGKWVTGVPKGPWDACFYDYGTHERGPSFLEFLEKTKNMIWIDDAHDTDLFADIKDKCATQGLVLHAHYGSIDEHGRFGAYVMKNIRSEE